MCILPLKYSGRRSFPSYPLNYVLRTLERLKLVCGNTWTAEDFAWASSSRGRGSVTSAQFRQKLASCRQFGLVKSSGGRFSFTDLAKDILYASSLNRFILSKQQSFFRIEPFKELVAVIQKAIGARGFDIDELTPFIVHHLGITERELQKFRHVFYFSAEEAGIISPGVLDPDAKTSVQICYLDMSQLHIEPKVIDNYFLKTNAH